MNSLSLPSFHKGQVITMDGHRGTVQRRLGKFSVQVRTVRDKLILTGFPPKPVGTERCLVTESWPVSRVVLAPAAA